MKRWCLAAVCLLLGGFVGSYFIAPLVSGQGKQPQPQSMPKELTSYRDIVKRVLPAVVSLDAKTKPKVKGQAPQADDLHFAQQLGETPKGGGAMRSTGGRV